MRVSVEAVHRKNTRRFLGARRAARLHLQQAAQRVLDCHACLVPALAALGHPGIGGCWVGRAMPRRRSRVCHPRAARVRALQQPQRQRWRAWSQHSFSHRKCVKPFVGQQANHRAQGSMLANTTKTLWIDFVANDSNRFLTDTPCKCTWGCHGVQRTAHRPGGTRLRPSAQRHEARAVPPARPAPLLRRWRRTRARRPAPPAAPARPRRLRALRARPPPTPPAATAPAVSRNHGWSA